MAHTALKTAWKQMTINSTKMVQAKADCTVIPLLGIVAAGVAIPGTEVAAMIGAVATDKPLHRSSFHSTN